MEHPLHIQRAKGTDCDGEGGGISIKMKKVSAVGSVTCAMCAKRSGHGKRSAQSCAMNIFLPLRRTGGAKTPCREIHAILLSHDLTFRASYSLMMLAFPVNVAAANTSPCWSYATYGVPYPSGKSKTARHCGRDRCHNRTVLKGHVRYTIGASGKRKKRQFFFDRMTLLLPWHDS